MKLRIFLVSFFILTLIPAQRYASELINDIIAIVGNTPITYMDLKEELEKPDVKSPDRRLTESQALDNLIEKAIIETVLKEEVISIPENQVDEIIKRSMKDNGFTDEKQFEAVLMQQMRMNLDSYKKEILHNLKVQQISQLKINPPQPLESEIRSWYNQHQKEIGNKYLLRIIRKKFNPSNIREEQAVNQQMNQAHGEALVDFAQAAKKYSDDPSASNGGILGWLRIDELVALDQTLANIVFRLTAGEVSMVFVSRDSYYILKVDALAPIPFEEASPMIAQKIFREKQAQAFGSWIRNKRKTSGVVILLKGYQEPR